MSCKVISYLTVYVCRMQRIKTMLDFYYDCHTKIHYPFIIIDFRRQYELPIPISNLILKNKS